MKEDCVYCGSLDWTVEKYGRVLHKYLCTHRTIGEYHQGSLPPKEEWPSNKKKQVSYCENQIDEGMLPCGVQCDTCKEQENNKEQVKLFNDLENEVEKMLLGHRGVDTRKIHIEECSASIAGLIIRKLQDKELENHGLKHTIKILEDSHDDYNKIIFDKNKEIAGYKKYDFMEGSYTQAQRIKELESKLAEEREYSEYEKNRADGAVEEIMKIDEALIKIRDLKNKKRYENKIN